MSDDTRRFGLPRQSQAAKRQIETIMDGIVQKNPRLRSAKEAVLSKDEPADRFAQEFLSVFRQKLQGE